MLGKCGGHGGVLPSTQLKPRGGGGVKGQAEDHRSMRPPSVVWSEDRMLDEGGGGGALTKHLALEEQWERSAATPGVTGATSKHESSVTMGLSFMRSDSGCTIPRRRQHPASGRSASGRANPLSQRSSQRSSSEDIVQSMW